MWGWMFLPAVGGAEVPKATVGGDGGEKRLLLLFRLHLAFARRFGITPVQYREQKQHTDEK